MKQQPWISLALIEPIIRTKPRPRRLMLLVQNPWTLKELKIPAVAEECDTSAMECKSVPIHGRYVHMRGGFCFR